MMKLLLDNGYSYIWNVDVVGLGGMVKVVFVVKQFTRLGLPAVFNKNI